MSNLLVWLAIIVPTGWFVLSVVVIVVRRDILRSEHELQIAVFCVFTWPAWLAIGVLGLPVVLGLLVGMLILDIVKQMEKTGANDQERPNP